MWGYSSGFDAFQHPGPVLCVDEGDTVTVILHNTLPEATSIMFPGQRDVLANGAPAQPQVGGAGNVTSLTDTAAADGGTITYSFVADDPGTFLYESGTDPETQVRMGLFGALIVRPAMGADYAYNRADSQFDPDEEFMVLLSEIDPYLHQAVEQGKPFNMNSYHPRYWLINGRGFPDSIADNGASWLPTQPYGALAQVGEFGPGHPDPGLARYLNVGTEDYPFHPHGNNGLVVGRDGRPLAGPAGEDLSFEKFAINIGPGQTWDVIFRWYDAEDYDPVTKPVPVHGAEPRELRDRRLLQRQPVPGDEGVVAAGHADAQPVRRVLHHLAQPRAVPDHLVGREHDRPHHVHADRPADAQRLRLTREAGDR